MTLPLIPAKRYFTIGEVSELCGVKPYVLRYWEQEFSQLKPMKRRGNRRYYQRHEVLLIRRIRGLLYDQGFTISGARNRLADAGGTTAASDIDDLVPDPAVVDDDVEPAVSPTFGLTGTVDGDLDASSWTESTTGEHPTSIGIDAAHLRAELLAIRKMLSD